MLPLPLPLVSFTFVCVRSESSFAARVQEVLFDGDAAAFTATRICKSGVYTPAQEHILSLVVARMLEECHARMSLLQARDRVDRVDRVHMFGQATFYFVLNEQLIAHPVQRQFLHFFLHTRGYPVRPDAPSTDK